MARRNQTTPEITANKTGGAGPVNQATFQAQATQLSVQKSQNTSISPNESYPLPSGSVMPRDNTSFNRNIIKWYVPEVGIINMYVNPNNIQYKHNKIIGKERTKGGYSLQYWGEDLSSLGISGTTGSSGIEGINVLYEIYRSEQYTFDPIGLTMAANSSMSGLSDLVNQAFSGLNQIGSVTSSLTNGFIGANPLSQTLLPKNPQSLASLAFNIEMYYAGWVFRGYFMNFNFTERADNFLMEYNFEFVITQRRGYRLNNLPFQRSANSGPSNSDIIPLSVNSLKK